MFRRIIMMAGVSLTQMAGLMGITKQNLYSKFKSQNIALLFTIIKLLDAKLMLEYKDGSRLDLMQYSEEFSLVERPDLKRQCKEA